MAKKNQQLVINQIITRPANRQILDVGKWRTALKSADTGRYQQLLDLYDDILLDGVLADAIDKRIRAVTGSDLTFQYKDGTEGDDMIALIDTVEFEQLLVEIMQALFQYISVIELNFDERGMHIYSVPRKHIRADQHSIAISENDPVGAINYADVPNIIEVRNRKDKYGILLRACPYAIFKRGGLSDWAQMVEIFGMPKRIGKYSIYDTEARKALEEAFNSEGAAATLIVPKETEIDTDKSSSTVNSTLYKDFIDTLDDQLLITILSQTMTTKDGSSRSQSETHKEVEEGLNKHDLRFVQRVLNQKVLPVLEARGYPVKDGTFVFPKATEQISVEQLVQLSDVLDIPAYYAQERYGIPQAGDKDVLMKRAQKPAEPTEPVKPTDPTDPKEPTEPTKPGKSKKEEKPFNNADERAFWMRLSDFFSDAPTQRSGANLKMNWISSTVDTISNLSDTVHFGINIDKLFDQAIQEVYASVGQELINAKLYTLSNTPLQQAVATGFTTNFGKKNEDFVSEFRHNVAVFAAFKAHQEGNEIAKQLIDNDGNLRSFHEFKKAVLGTSIKADYNKNWLKTEYNMAVRSARMAEKFKKFETTKHLYPNLEYLPSTAVNKRPEHVGFYGTILPIEHPWWDTHMPPLDWGCECGIRNTDKPVTPVPDESEPPNPVLANNPAKTAEFININEHPYVKNCEEEVRNQIIASVTAKKIIASRELAKKWMQKNIPAGKSVEIAVKAKHIDKLTITRASIKTILSKGHDDVIARNRAITNLTKLFKDAEYYGWAEDEEIDGVQKHTDTNYWLYYKSKIGYICVKYTKAGEYKPHAIVVENEFMKNPNVKKGETPTR